MKRFLSVLLITLSLLAVSATSVSAASDCETHTGKIVTVRATTKEKGSVQQVCKKCKKVMASTPLARIRKIYLEETNYVYDGKVKKPKVTVMDTSGRVLISGTDYTVSYASGRKVCGKYKVTVKFKGNYKGSKNLYFTITPQETQFDTTQVKSNRSVKLKWDKAKSGVTGYKLQYSTSSKFKKGTVTTKVIKGYKNVSKTLSDLKKNKTYYFRIRTYNTYKGKTTYSDWSEVRTLYLSRVNYSVKQLLNAEKLKPQKTNHKELDALVGKIFKKIHKPNMTTEQKVRACYDYLVKNMTYGNGFVDPYRGTYYTFYDERMANNAYQILKTKTGVCDHYSAAFMVMCRRIGLEAYEIDGEVESKSGGYTGHAWAYIVLNGEKYVFDPQVQSRNKQAPYYFYGKTYAQMGDMYYIGGSYYNPKTFNNFERPRLLTEQKRNMVCKLKTSGADGTISLTAKQSGKSVAYSARDYFSPPAKTYGNNVAKLNLNITGGSGEYEIILYNANTKNIAYSRTCSGKLNWYIDISPKELYSRTYDLVIYDHNDYNSYLAIEDIRFAKNS